MKGKATAMAVLWGLAFCGNASGLEATIPVTNVSTINHGLGGNTYRLDLGSLGVLSEEMVLWARLSLPLSGNVAASELNVIASGLLAAGGDPDPAQASEARLEAGAAPSSLEIDLTDLVRAVADGETVNYGLVLHPSDAARIGFTDSEAAVLGPLLGGELKVSYRKLTAYGIRGGAAAFAERKRSQSLDDRRRRPDPEAGTEATSRPQ